MDNNLIKIVNATLPALSGSSVTYNEANNIFLSEGYTSAAGNTYFQGVRLSDRLIIDLQLGQGYYYLFLNGIRIYGYNGHEKHLIASRNFSCCTFSEKYSCRECEDMIKDYLYSQSKLMGQTVDNSTLESFAHSLIAETMKNQIDNIKKIC
jgi:hypothetical protein